MAVRFALVRVTAPHAGDNVHGSDVEETERGIRPVFGVTGTPPPHEKNYVGMPNYFQEMGKPCGIPQLLF